MLVLLLAHELRHLWQFANSPRAAMTFEELLSEAEESGHQICPERLAARKAAETDADQYAKAMVGEYRRRIAHEIPNAVAQSPPSCVEHKWVQLPLQLLVSP